MVTRRGFLRGCLGVVLAPAIVRASSLMPVGVIEPAAGIGLAWGDRVLRTDVAAGVDLTEVTVEWVEEVRDFGNVLVLTAKLHEWVGLEDPKGRVRFEAEQRRFMARGVIGRKALTELKAEIEQQMANHLEGRPWVMV